MARFGLTQGVDDKQLGKLVLEIAEEAGKNGGQLDEGQKSLFKGQLRDMINFAGDIDVVYDTPNKVHIVIPYLGEAVYSDNNLANEAMGYIVIRGCGL